MPTASSSASHPPLPPPTTVSLRSLCPRTQRGSHSATSSRSRTPQLQYSHVESHQDTDDELEAEHNLDLADSEEDNASIGVRTKRGRSLSSEVESDTSRPERKRPKLEQSEGPESIDQSLYASTSRVAASQAASSPLTSINTESNRSSNTSASPTPNTYLDDNPDPEATYDRMMDEFLLGSSEASSAPLMNSGYETPDPDILTNNIAASPSDISYSDTLTGPQLISPDLSTRPGDSTLAAAYDAEIISSPSSSSKSSKGKGKEKAHQPAPPEAVSIDTVEPLAAYTCPICFSPPSYATITPCGHVLCGECLFTAVKTTLQRGTYTAPYNETMAARCPVCRASIPGWDGKGGGVIGLRPRAVFSL